MFVNKAVNILLDKIMPLFFYLPFKTNKKCFIARMQRKSLNFSLITNCENKNVLENKKSSIEFAHHIFLMPKLSEICR